MKKIFLIPAVLTALVLCSTHALAQETSDAGQINILENGQIDGLTEWVIVGVADKPENNYVKEQILAYDANESHGSDWSGSLKIGNIDLKNGFKPWQAWRHRDILIEPGATYAIGVWVKTADMPKTANVYLGFGFKSEDNKWLTGWIPGSPEKNSIDHRTSLWIDKTKGTHDWVELTGTVTAPKDAVKIGYLQARVDNIISAPEAKVWFDDFKIVKVK